MDRAEDEQGLLIQKRVLAYVQELELHIKIVKRARIAFDDDEYETTIQQLIQQLPVIRRHRNEQQNDTSSSDSSDADEEPDHPPIFFFYQNVLYRSHDEYMQETHRNPMWKMHGHDTRLLLLQQLDKSLQILSENRKQMTDKKYFMHVRDIMSEMIRIPPYRFDSDEQVNRVSRFNNDDGSYDFSYPTMDLDEYRSKLIQRDLNRATFNRPL